MRIEGACDPAFALKVLQAVVLALVLSALRRRAA
jgi:hypothetical protein